MFPLQVAESIINLGKLGAVAINSVGVLIAVQAIKYLMPILRAKYPWALPLIASVAGIGLGAATNYLSAKLGYPVDLSAILAALTGTAAVAIHQVGTQASKGS